MKRQIFNFLALLILLCSLALPAVAHANAQQGIFTDKQWKYADGKLTLKGEWQVIWGKLVEPNSFDQNYKGDLFTIPNNWNQAGNQADGKNGTYGVATFRLMLNLPEYNKPLSFHVISPNSAWKLYQNGQLLGGNGVVSTNPSTAETHYISRIFSAQAGNSQLVLQIANFSHAYGGPEYVIELWDAAQHKQKLDFMSLSFSIALGILFSIGLIHMIFYLADRKHREQGPVHLWFSLLCFILVFRISGIVPYFHIYAPESLYWSSLKMPYLSLYAAPATYLLFFRSIFPNQFPAKLTQYIIWLSALMMAFTLLTPEYIYTKTKYFSIALNIFVIVYSLYFTINAVRAKQGGAIAILVANFLFFLTALNDANIYIFNGDGFDMTPFGFVLLGLGYSYALLVRLQNTFNQARNTSQALEVLNLDLEQKVLDRTAAYKNAAAKAANSANEKAQFIAAASHDLRQPLHALSLFNLALKRQTIDEKTSKIIEKQGAAIENLSHLLQDTLDASKVESMRRQPELASFNLSDLFEKLSTSFAIRAENQNTNLTITSEIGKIVSDSAMLQRILGNLIDNSLKAAQSYVKIAATQQGKNWQFTVTDDGAGIDQKHISRIFESYVSISETHENETGGYGLGLYVVSEFTKLLNGTISYENLTPQGSRFTLTFAQSNLNQQYKSTSNNAADMASTPHFNLNILTIDDEPDILSAMQEILQSWGCQSLIATSLSTAKNALKIAEKSGITPDLLLVDFHLHSENGVDVVKKLRKILGRNIPAAIISGATQSSVLDIIDKASLPFLPKPIDAHSLAALLQKIENKSAIKQAQL